MQNPLSCPKGVRHGYYKGWSIAIVPPPPSHFPVLFCFVFSLLYQFPGTTMTIQTLKLKTMETDFLAGLEAKSPKVSLG